MGNMSDRYKNINPRYQEKLNLKILGEHGRITLCDRELRKHTQEITKNEKICLNCNRTFNTLGNRICGQCKRTMENSFLDRRKGSIK